MASSVCPSEEPPGPGPLIRPPNINEISLVLFTSFVIPRFPFIWGIICLK